MEVEKGFGYVLLTQFFFNSWQVNLSWSEHTISLLGKSLHKPSALLSCT